jgi:predicted nucleic acid-binding protein
MKLKLVVDNNIIFSAILNPESRIGKMILGSKDHFQLYSCDFLKAEILKHQVKLLKLSRLTTQELDELMFLLTKKIIFINENLLPE